MCVNREHPKPGESRRSMSGVMEDMATLKMSYKSPLPGARWLRTPRVFGVP